MLKFRWNGKLITEKMYYKRLQQVEIGKKRRKNKVGEERVEENDKGQIKRRRIVDLEVMAAHMYCSSCKEVLSLEYIEGEIQKGLGSIFHIRCHKCLLINCVPSGLHCPTEKQKIFDVNNKVVLGTLHAGLGYSSINKLFRVMNIPFMAGTTFKRYERKVGPAVKEIATASCKEATELETLKKIEQQD